MTALDADTPCRTKGYHLGLTLGPRLSLITLSGDIDLAATGDLTHLLDSLSILTVPVHVDMAAVTFLDSSGVAPLVEATRQRAAPSPPIIIGERSQPVRHLLRAAGLGDEPVLDVEAWDQLSVTSMSSDL